MPSFWDKLFGYSGSMQMPSDPKFEEYNDRLGNYDPGLGFAGKYYKGLMKRIGRGDDVSSFGELESERQRAATERRGIEEDYGSGALQLEQAAGSAQAPLIQRMKEMGLDRASERHGMNLQRGYTDLRREAAGGYEDARRARIGAELNALGQATDNQLNYTQYRNRPEQKQGWLSRLNQVAGVAAGFAGLPKAFATGGWGGN
jgi:hypothetical protein